MASTAKRLKKTVEQDIDRRIAEAKAAGVSALDLSMMEKLLKPWCVSMEVNRLAETDADDFINSTFWILSVIAVEAVLNTSRKDHPDEVYAHVNRQFKVMADHVTNMIQSSIDVPKSH
jgi:preprotein translocase subunit SecA